MKRVDHIWGEDNTYVSDGSFGIDADPKHMEVVTPTDNEHHIRLCGMICAYACTALENNLPLNALKIHGKRRPHNPFSDN